MNYLSYLFIFLFFCLLFSCVPFFSNYLHSLSFSPFILIFLFVFIDVFLSFRSVIFFIFGTIRCYLCIFFLPYLRNCLLRLSLCVTSFHPFFLSLLCPFFRKITCSFSLYHFLSHNSFISLSIYLSLVQEYALQYSEKPHITLINWKIRDTNSYRSQLYFKKYRCLSQNV